MLGATFCCRWMWGSCSVARKSISKDPEERRIYLGGKMKGVPQCPISVHSIMENQGLNRVNDQRFFVMLKISSGPPLAG